MSKTAVLEELAGPEQTNTGRPPIAGVVVVFHPVIVAKVNGAFRLRRSISTR
jgi:hypothetical protein